MNQNPQEGKKKAKERTTENDVEQGAARRAGGGGGGGLAGWLAGSRLARVAAGVVVHSSFYPVLQALRSTALECF